MAVSIVPLLLAAALVPASYAADQIAYWTDPNAAFLRDVIYISGGDRYNVGPSSLVEYRPPHGALYNISLCDSFTTADNNIDFLIPQDLYPATNQPPYYVGGAMFATDNNFYTYGGLQSTNSSDNGIIFGQAFQDTPTQDGWGWGFTYDTPGLGNMSTTSRQLALGSWTSAPSTNLAFWFSGLRAADRDPILYTVSDGPEQANTPAKDFIVLDLGEENKATAQNRSWPAGVEPRAEGALVWLPYGDQGMLLAFGGIGMPNDMGVTGLYPSYNSTSGTNDYMTSILVYDIATDQWQSQQTDRTAPYEPKQLASFCTVVASAPDNSSHHIYVYGGYDGTYKTDSDAYDTVWVLSIPTFRWTMLSVGVPNHARQNHVCVKMNAKTMLSIGGNMAGSPLNSTAFDVYDLSSGTWTSNYEPNATAVFTVPATVTSNVADLTTIPSNLVPQVSTWLGSNYQGHITGPILDSCPAKASPPSQTTPVPPGHHDSWKVPVAAAVASVGGVAILAGLLWCFCIRRRRRGGRSEDTKRNSILSWVNRSGGTPAAPKSMPDSENTVIATPVDYFGTKGVQGEAYEMLSNVPSPGYNHSYSHGSPQIVPGGSTTSPFMGSAEVDAQSRHEIMDHVPRAGSSFGPNLYSMHSVSARNNPMSVRSDSVSHASEAVMHSRHYGYVSPYELAHDRSREDLITPPTDLALGEPRNEQAKNASTHSLGVGADKVSSPAVMTPIAPITRTIDSAGTAEDTENDRPHHIRNQSSMSSNLPNLPLPGLEEDRRRSRVLETLLDPSSGQASPVQAQTAKKSAYTENLDS